jgi:hypothetical protein
MTRRRMSWLAFGVLVVLTGASCGDGAETVAPPTTAPFTIPTTTIATSSQSTLPPPTTVPPPDGVETFSVTAGHSADPIVYPQVPPVGGIHNPTWQTCTFYDKAVPNETAVHSLEHGAIWITYRPDLPADQLAVLSRLGLERKDVLVSKWEDGLPAPVVASSWDRQLKLPSAHDPRLMQFIRAFTGKAPEPSAPC